LSKTPFYKAFIQQNKRVIVFDKLDWLCQHFSQNQPGEFFMDSKSQRRHPLVKFALPLIGFGLLVTGLITGLTNLDFYNKSSPTTGIIIGYETVISRDRSSDSSLDTTTTYKATIAYQVNGQNYQFTSASSSARLPREGKRVKLYYLNDDPFIAKMPADLFLLPAALAFFGLIIILALVAGHKLQSSEKFLNRAAD
jgi:hypothetical protein